MRKVYISSLSLLIFFIPLINFSQETQIGNQIWQEHNLNVCFFRNGDSIPQAKSILEWREAAKNKKPAWCYYDNDSSALETKGRLYNYYAVSDSRGIAPEGWRIPEQDDFSRLVDYYNKLIKNKALEGRALINAQNLIANLKDNFENAQNDSILITQKRIYKPTKRKVQKRSSIYPGRFSVSKIPDNVIEEIEKMEEGKVLVVNVDSRNFRLFKKVGYQSVEYASMQYLLLGKKLYPDIGKAKELADSILKVIQKKNNFDEMVTQFSTDYGSVSRGGRYRNIEHGVMVKNIEDFIFNNPVGSFKVVPTVFGLSLVEVLDKSTELRPIVLEINTKIENKSSVATHLKRQNSWDNFLMNAQSDNKFRALPCGIRSDDGAFFYGGEATIFWTQTTFDPDFAMTASLYSSIVAPTWKEENKLNFKYSTFGYGLSVRCIKVVD